MIQRIKQTKALKPYQHQKIEDAGVAVDVDEKLSEQEYIGIKVDDYYMGLKLQGETPKAVDFIVVVDCGFNWYTLYILEMKDTNSYTTRDIHEKFDTAINRFLQVDFKEIFLDDRYKYRLVKLYLVRPFKPAEKYSNYEEYKKIQEKIRTKDTLAIDQKLGDKIYRFRNLLLRIEREIPPNPLIVKVK